MIYHFLDITQHTNVLTTIVREGDIMSKNEKKVTVKLNSESVINEMNDFLATIDNNVTTNLIKGGATYAQLFGDTVATRIQVFFMSTSIDVYAGNMTRTYELMNDENMYRRDTKQRLRKFKSIDEFKEFMQQLTVKEAVKTTKKRVTTKKVSKKASASA